jgi:hypothetical protein
MAVAVADLLTLAVVLPMVAQVAQVVAVQVVHMEL